MSEEIDSNAKTVKTKMNISISKECKARIATLADVLHRSTSQQAEHILELWYQNNISKKQHETLSEQED